MKGYPLRPVAYLLNTLKKLYSISRLRLSRSFGGRTGVIFLMVIVRSPTTAVLICFDISLTPAT